MADKITEKINEILLRFRVQAQEFEARILPLRHTISWHSLRENYYSRYRMSVNKALIREVGVMIIEPYQENPLRKVNEFFLTWYRYPQELTGDDKLYPDLDDFIQWYCSSDQIRKEIDGKTDRDLYRLA